MTDRQALIARRDALKAELARREASRSTSDRQAALILASDCRSKDDERDEFEDDEPSASERQAEMIERDNTSRLARGRRTVDRSDRTARTQARQILGGSRRRRTRSWDSEE